MGLGETARDGAIGPGETVRDGAIGLDGAKPAGDGGDGCVRSWSVGLRGYRGTSLIRNSALLGIYRRTMPRAL